MFSSQIPQYFHTLHSSPCRQSPRNRVASGKWGASGTRYSVTGNGCENRDTPTALDGVFIHPCPAALLLTAGLPLKLSFMFGSQASLPGRIGFPHPKGFCLSSDHNFQTDTDLNYHLFSNVISDMFTPQCLISLFTVTRKSVTLCFAAKQL